METNALIQLLEKQAADIARAGHNDWGNTMLLASEALCAQLPAAAPAVVDAAEKKDNAMTPEELDNLAANVAQISLSVDYLYDSMNILSYQLNSLHVRLAKLEVIDAERAAAVELRAQIAELEKQIKVIDK